MRTNRNRIVCDVDTHTNNGFIGATMNKMLDELTHTHTLCLSGQMQPTQIIMITIEWFKCDFFKTN